MVRDERALEGMDKAAEVAAQELETLDPAAVRTIADWWKAHYLACGHKRLGRKLLAKATSIASELEELVKE